MATSEIMGSLVVFPLVAHFFAFASALPALMLLVGSLAVLAGLTLRIATRGLNYYFKTSHVQLGTSFLWCPVLNRPGISVTSTQTGHFSSDTKTNWAGRGSYCVRTPLQLGRSSQHIGRPVRSVGRPLPVGQRGAFIGEPVPTVRGIGIPLKPCIGPPVRNVESPFKSLNIRERTRFYPNIEDTVFKDSCQSESDPSIKAMCPDLRPYLSSFNASLSIRGTPLLERPRFEIHKKRNDSHRCHPCKRYHNAILRWEDENFFCRLKNLQAIHILFITILLDLSIPWSASKKISGHLLIPAV
nr:hypothetical protein HmN_000947500 [Hymenolepis microstoma]